MPYILPRPILSARIILEPNSICGIMIPIMSKISISHPQSTGTPLYGSQRLHNAFVTIDISLGNGGDHFGHASGDDTGFKGAHDSKIKRIEQVYDKARPSFSFRDERDPATGLYKIGLMVGSKFVDAPEIKESTEVISIAMSFEQFAEMLVSTGHQVDCTVQSFRPIGDPSRVYGEDVTSPASISDRAERRMEKAQAEALEEIDKGLADIDSWKATEKIKDAARKNLRQVRQHIINNMGFVVTQASEEISKAAEGAISIIADKVAALEREGRLPPGTLDQLRNGGDNMGLILGNGD